MRQVITTEDVAADPTNCFQVTVNGDVPIKRLTIHGDAGNEWTYIEYENGSNSSGTPLHWHTYVRVTDDASKGHSMTTCGSTDNHAGETFLDVSHCFVKDTEGNNSFSADPSASGGEVCIYAGSDTDGRTMFWMTAEQAEQAAAQLLCAARFARQSARL